LKDDEPGSTAEERGWPFADEEKETDEAEAIEEASLDLVRLDRYYRRVWSRQKRAIRTFINRRENCVSATGRRPAMLP